MDGLLADMTTGQFLEWQAYEMLEPFGHPIANRRHAEVCGSACRGDIPMERFLHKPAVQLGDTGRRFLSAGEIKSGLMSVG